MLSVIMQSLMLIIKVLASEITVSVLYYDSSFLEQTCRSRYCTDVSFYPSISRILYQFQRLVALVYQIRNNSVAVTSKALLLSLKIVMGLE